MEWPKARQTGTGELSWCLRASAAPVDGAGLVPGTRGS